MDVSLGYFPQVEIILVPPTRDNMTQSMFLEYLFLHMDKIIILIYSIIEF
jgi:hypothetical protein